MQKDRAIVGTHPSLKTMREQRQQRSELPQFHCPKAPPRLLRTNAAEYPAVEDNVAPSLVWGVPPNNFGRPELNCLRVRPIARHFHNLSPDVELAAGRRADSSRTAALFRFSAWTYCKPWQGLLASSPFLYERAHHLSRTRLAFALGVTGVLLETQRFAGLG